MAKGNPKPCTAHLRQKQGEQALGRVIGTRYPPEVEALLRQMPGERRQEFIRRAVANELRRIGEKASRHQSITPNNPERVKLSSDRVRSLPNLC